MQIATSQNAGKIHQWMTCPQVKTEYPSLAHLNYLQELIIAEYKDALHDIVSKKGFAYTIFNSEGQKIFIAILEKNSRNFHVKIFNNYGNEVIHVKRSFLWCSNKVTVWAPPGNYVGSVKETGWFSNTYIVKNEHGKVVLKILDEEGDKEFKIYVAYTPHTIGFVKDQWSSVLNVKNFGISFPPEIDVKDKAVLLGACFLIGYLNYNE